MIYGTCETLEQEIERKFSAIIRIWQMHKRAGREPEITLLEIGRTEFGLTDNDYKRIHKNVAKRIYRGVSSDVMIELIKEWQLEKFGARKKAA